MTPIIHLIIKITVVLLALMASVLAIAALILAAPSVLLWAFSSIILNWGINSFPENTHCSAFPAVNKKRKEIKNDLAAVECLKGRIRTRKHAPNRMGNTHTTTIKGEGCYGWGMTPEESRLCLVRVLRKSGRLHFYLPNVSREAGGKQI